MTKKFEIISLNRFKSYVWMTLVHPETKAEIEVGAVCVAKPKDCDTYVRENQRVQKAA